MGKVEISMDITKKFFTRNSESEVTMRIGIAGFAVVFFLIAGASPALCASDSASTSRGLNAAQIVGAA